MYTLRNIDNEGVANHCLGNCYGTVNRFENPKRFRELFYDVFDRNHVADLDEKSDDNTQHIIGFVLGNNDNIHPIDQRESYYVMTSDGGTFESLNRSLTKQQVVTE